MEITSTLRTSPVHSGSGTSSIAAPVGTSALQVPAQEEESALQEAADEQRSVSHHLISRTCHRQQCCFIQFLQCT